MYILFITVGLRGEADECQKALDDACRRVARLIDAGEATKEEIIAEIDNVDKVQSNVKNVTRRLDDAITEYEENKLDKTLIVRNIV